MGWDFAFDTETKDTIPDGKGSIVLTDGADTQVALQFECDFAAWWGDPRAGFRKGLATASAIQADAQRALNVLVSDGVISNATALAEESREVPGRVKLLTTARDTRTGRTIKTRPSR